MAMAAFKKRHAVQERQLRGNDGPPLCELTITDMIKTGQEILCFRE
jgi:hypothetical protein